jgi:hypothetical protein
MKIIVEKDQPDRNTLKLSDLLFQLNTDSLSMWEGRCYEIADPEKGRDYHVVISKLTTEGISIYYLAENFEKIKGHDFVKFREGVDADYYAEYTVYPDFSKVEFNLTIKHE